MQLRGALHHPGPLGQGALQILRDQEEREAQNTLEAATTPVQETAQSAGVTSQLSHARSKKMALTKGGSSTHAQNPESSSAASSSGLMKTWLQELLEISLLTTLGAVNTQGSWEVKLRDQAISPTEQLPRNHGPVAFATSLATLRKLVL